MLKGVFAFISRWHRYDPLYVQTKHLKICIRSIYEYSTCSNTYQLEKRLNQFQSLFSTKQVPMYVFLTSVRPTIHVELIIGRKD